MKNYYCLFSLFNCQFSLVLWEFFLVYAGMSSLGFNHYLLMALQVRKKPASFHMYFNVTTVFYRFSGEFLLIIVFLNKHLPVQFLATVEMLILYPSA